MFRLNLTGKFMAKQQRGCQVHGSASCQRTIFYLLTHYKNLTARFLSARLLQPGLQSAKRQYVYFAEDYAVVSRDNCLSSRDDLIGHILKESFLAPLIYRHRQ